VELVETAGTTEDYPMCMQEEAATAPAADIVMTAHTKRVKKSDAVVLKYLLS